MSTQAASGHQKDHWLWEMEVVSQSKVVLIPILLPILIEFQQNTVGD